MMQMTLGHEVRALDAMNSLGLWMILVILHLVFKPLYAMNNQGL